MEKGNTKFKSKNLFCSSYLKASGKVKLIGIEPVDPFTKQFVFEPAETASLLEVEYFSGEALPAKSLFAAYVELRKLLKEETKNG